MIYILGGIDLVPTHHENEIAQNKGCCGKVPARFWMHCEFLLINGGKMSKSLGNAYLIDDIINKGYEPLSYKMLCFTSHYRNKLNFTWEALDAAQNSLNKLRDGYRKHLNGIDNIGENEIFKLRESFLEAINDDLNIPSAMSVVWSIIKNPSKSKELAGILLDFDRVLGLDIDKEQEKTHLPEEVIKMIEERKQAREEKNWAKSDEIRDKLQEMGYIVKDSKDGMTVEKK